MWQAHVIVRHCQKGDVQFLLWYPSCTSRVWTSLLPFPQQALSSLPYFAGAGQPQEPRGKEQGLQHVAEGREAAAARTRFVPSWELHPYRGGGTTDCDVGWGLALLIVQCLDAICESWSCHREKFCREWSISFVTGCTVWRNGYQIYFQVNRS